jgi:predicted ATP-grasp superfamily ATP-dependent carboligase
MGLTQFHVGGNETALSAAVRENARRAGVPALACVLGGMDLVRPLGLAGIRSAVVSAPDGLAQHSRFVRAVIPWRDEEIAEGAEGLVDGLLRFAASQKTKPILFYDQDASLLFVSRNRERLRQGFHLLVPDAVLVEDLVDKGRFQSLAERLKLPVPPARLLSASAALPADLGLRFPVVVKPLWRCRCWAEDAKVVQVDSMPALRAAWPRLASQCADLLVQEMVAGPESCIESYHVYVDRQGLIAGGFTGRKIRTFPISHGHSTALVLTAAEDVAALGRSLVGRLGLRGLAKFDFKRDPDGRLHLLEVNPRFTLWHHLGALGGVNLPALVYADLTGSPRPAASLRRTDVRWCRLLGDWRAARASGLSLAAWLPFALGCEASLLSWDDPMPLLRALWRSASQRVGGGKPAWRIGRASVAVSK